MTLPVAERISVALRAGRPREAAEILDAERPPLDRNLVSLAAEALAASGRERRATALLTLAARRYPHDRALALEAGRSLLRRGMRRRALHAVAAHGASILLAVAARQALPAVDNAEDREDEIDRALAGATTTQALQALLEKSPGSVRLRLAVAARALDENRAADARAVLRAGLQGREDARLELALASVAIVAGTWDEAAIVVARTRARFPRLARDPTILALHGFVTVGAGRRDETVSLLQAAGAGPMGGALLSLLALPNRPHLSSTQAPGGPSLAPAPTGANLAKTATAATTASVGASPPKATAPGPAGVNLPMTTTATLAAGAGLPPSTSGTRPLSALMQATLARAGQGGSKGVGPSLGASAVAPSTGPASASLGSAAPAAGSVKVGLGDKAPTPSSSSATRLGAAFGDRRPTPSTPAKKPGSTSQVAGGAQPPKQPPTFRRLEVEPDRASKPRFTSAMVVVAVCVVFGVWAVGRSGPPAADAAPPLARSAFAQKLERCGFKVADWVDVNVAPTALATAAQKGWNGSPASLTAEPTAVDAKLASGVKFLSLRTGAKVEPALVVTPSADRIVGLGWFAATRERPPVTSLVGALKFTRIAPWSCPQAGAGATCVVGMASCEDLVIRVQAICVGQTTASLMPRCELDAAIVGPRTLLLPRAKAAAQSSPR